MNPAEWLLTAYVTAIAATWAATRHRRPRREHPDAPQLGVGPHIDTTPAPTDDLTRQLEALYKAPAARRTP